MVCRGVMGSAALPVTGPLIVVLEIWAVGYKLYLSTDTFDFGEWATPVNRRPFTIRRRTSWNEATHKFHNPAMWSGMSRHAGWI
jgi:hypothetical protein